MPNEIRPCALPAYWKAEEPIEACDIISFGFNWANDSILAFETVWKGQTSKNAYPELNLAELKDVKKWIDERYYSSDFESIDKADKEFLQLKYYRETAFLITEALNAPVLATEEVLAGLPEEGVFYIQDKDGERRLIEKNTRNKDPKTHRWQYRGRRIIDVGSTHRIVGGDAMSQEYLRQFTLEGVRIKEGG